MPKLSRVGILFGLIMLGLVAAAVYVSVLIVERQSIIRQTARYNVTWLASQAAFEVVRFEEVVAASALPNSPVTADDVDLRYQILLNRLELMNSGEFEDFVEQDPERRQIVADLGRVLAEIAPLVEKVSQGDNVSRIRAMLAPLDKKLAGLAASANRVSGDNVDADQRNLLRLHWIFSSLIAALVIAGLVLMLMLYRRHIQLNRAHDEVHVLAGVLEEAKLDLEQANVEILSTNADLKQRNEMLQIRDVELRTQNQRFDAALNNMSQGLLLVDGMHRLIVCNQRYREIFNLREQWVQPGATIRALGTQRFAGLIDRQNSIAADRASATFAFELDDDTIVSVSQQPMPDGGWVSTYEDITERRRSEERIAHMAHHDALTDLPNRTLFRARMDDALADKRGSKANFAIFYLDLDNFKIVNDSLGHAVGDLLLRSVADRLKECVRDGDIVSRFGGDEFAIMFRGGGGSAEMQGMAQRLVDRTRQPFSIEGNELSIGTCVGIAIAGKDGLDSDELLRNADMALYRAKNEGRGSYRFFEASMKAELNARRALEEDLRSALGAGEFAVHYQPIVNLKTMTVVSFEALIRWNHPERGEVVPAEFVPVAEETGLIVAIGEWVLRQACVDAASWPGPTRVSVNLSAVQFRTGQFAQTVFAALSASGLAPNRLELEITETVLLQDSEATLAILHQLRSFGIRTCMDDFGTGYSSLSYLRSFPFDKIKIDRSFVSEVNDREDCRAIVTSITDLGRSLNMVTTAEGVETRAQFDTINEIGCAEIQGFYFGHPVPAAEVEEAFTRIERLLSQAA
ncbi:putative bifunctional diguanylate cyclase/phosphodiesterase [Phreatobacter stygius]|nr:EAL domain-containing protein [Phreatobacter stygius]